MMHTYFQTLARYNAWANQRLYAACASLDDAAYYSARGAFFGSIHGTLNHILVGDRLWMARLEGTETPALTLDQILYDDRDQLAAARRDEDARIAAFVATLDAKALDGALHYRDTRGNAHTTPLALVLGHLFNHQTHHRGQVHGLLSQVPCDPPPLDLIYFTRESRETA